MSDDSSIIWSDDNSRTWSWRSYTIIRSVNSWRINIYRRPFWRLDSYRTRRFAWSVCRPIWWRSRSVVRRSVLRTIRWTDTRLSVRSCSWTCHSDRLILISRFEIIIRFVCRLVRRSVAATGIRFD